MYKLLIIGLFLLIPGVFADTNGVWIDAKDVKSGTFGSDESGGNYEFPSNLDVGGDFNAPSIETSDLVSGSVDITDNEGSLRMIGVDHSYIEFYPQGESSGRKGWLGYGEAGDTEFTIQDYSNLLLNPLGGNVGIGTKTPSSKLDVVGNIRANTLFSNGEEVATNNYVDSQITNTRNYIDSEITNTRNYVDSEVSNTRNWVSSQNYATESWVNNKGYATKSYVNSNDNNLQNQIDNLQTQINNIEVASPDLYQGYNTEADCKKEGGSIYEVGGESFCKVSESTCGNLRGDWRDYKEWSRTVSDTCTGNEGHSCTTGSHSTFQNKAPETCEYSSCREYGYRGGVRGGCTSWRDSTCHANKVEILCY